MNAIGSVYKWCTVTIWWAHISYAVRGVVDPFPFRQALRMGA
jgi:hypothetical protein